uniref:T-cell receptor alpha/delta variable 26.0 n=1 Tax=Cyprinus carpio TaxID=7962 RepID=A0A8C1Y7W0_CYPCA
MERCVLLILITVPGKVHFTRLEQTEDSNKEGESVTLSCIYDTSSNNILLYWYRQYPNKDPQYLLYKGARSWSNNRNTADHRFQSITSESSTELTTDSVTLSDSALYYCALRVEAQ